MSPFFRSRLDLREEPLSFPYLFIIPWGINICADNAKNLWIKIQMSFLWDSFEVGVQFKSGLILFKD